jgi:hypothetical protein
MTVYITDFKQKICMTGAVQVLKGKLVYNLSVGSAWLIFLPEGTLLTSIDFQTDTRHSASMKPDNDCTVRTWLSQPSILLAAFGQHKTITLYFC